ncbi:MAG: hypothetical protein MRERV_6c076 [Mycoplasmataceae bacterium RV_VA103A]|nr:MAG: hypothetical protein MRERV_6c076 [Mycoplasmataceae bacterium RV_VA103A]
MNQNNNIFNKYDIENKLKDFKKGQDYSISPTDEPNIKTYNFHNDKLRSMFRDDRVPVRITQEAYDGKDYAYRGHFEEGKDYSYSHRHWYYGENYQGNRGTDVFGDGEFKNSMDRIKWDEHYREITPNSWAVGWTYRVKDNLNKNNEPNFNSFPVPPLPDKENLLQAHCGECNKWINPRDGYFVCKEHKTHFCSSECANKWNKCEMEHVSGDLVKNDNHSDLRKENHELRQQLAEVKQQLAEVLGELRKLKNNSSGSDSEKLEQQIIHNEKLIKNSEVVSVNEIKDQINKSQALMNEVSATGAPNKDDKGSLPYVIGGSVLVGVAGIIGYLVVKSKRRYFAVGPKK